MGTPLSLYSYLPYGSSIKNALYRLGQVPLLLSLPHRMQIPPHLPLGGTPFCLSQSFPSSKVHFRPASSIKSSLTAPACPFFLLRPPTTQWSVVIIIALGGLVLKGLFILLIVTTPELGEGNENPDQGHTTST